MKRSTVVPLLLVALMVLAGIPGCQTDAQTQTTAPITSAAETAASSTETSETAEETLWSAPGEYPIVDETMELDIFAAVYDSNGPMAENQMTIWYEEKTNIHVNWEEVPQSDYQTKLALSLASGDYPDAYWNCDIATTQLQLYGGEGIFIALNDLIEEQAPNLAARFEEYPSALLSCTAPDGNIYSFFSVNEGLHMMTQQKMFVYQPWLDALGLSLPTTTEEFEAMLIAFRDEDPNGNGLQDEIPLMGSTDGWNTDPTGYLMCPFVLNDDARRLVVTDGVVSAAYMQDEWRDGLRYLKQLYDEGLLAKDSFVQDNSQLVALVSQGLVGAVPACFQLCFADSTVYTEWYDDWVAVAPLTGPSGNAVTPLTTDGISLLSFVITKDCEYPEIAVKWIDFWCSDEGAILSTFGFEGEQYTLSDDPAVDGTVPSYLRDADAYTTPITTYWAGQGVSFYTKKVSYIDTAVEGSVALDLYLTAQPYLDYFPEEKIPEILWKTSEQSNLISLLETPIMDYVDEAMVQFIVGDLNIDTDWDTYISELEAMDVEAYIQIYQDLYDALPKE